MKISISASISQLTELKNQLQSVEEKSRTETKSLIDQLHHLSAENASTKVENQRLKVFTIYYHDHYCRCC